MRRAITKTGVFAGAVLVLLAGCGGGRDASNSLVNATVPDACSVSEQNKFVLDVMNDIYYWVDQMPNANPDSFGSPEELLEFLVFADLDRFSVIVDEEEEDAFFSDSQFIGVGMGIRLIDETRLWVTQTFSDGPAAAAGIARGFEILSINGQTVAQMVAGDGISAAFGPNEIGTQVDLNYRDKAGNDLQVTLFKDVVTIETVSATAVFEAGGRVTGYIAFRNFVEPSFEALDAAFTEFANQGVQELVLDLRYNGGGLISVAEFLAGLLGGTVTDGNVFANRVHNAANTFRNVETRFKDEANALDLAKIIVITTSSTASASEMIINGLAPFVDVTIVGGQTSGKPVGSYGFDFCGKILRPISFANENAVGEGNYFSGFNPDCVVTDDLEHELGDPQEAMLAEALQLVETGACTAAGVKQNTKASPKSLSAHDARSRWRGVINAY